MSDLGLRRWLQAGARPETLALYNRSPKSRGSWKNGQICDVETVGALLHKPRAPLLALRSPRGVQYRTHLAPLPSGEMPPILVTAITQPR